MPLIATPTTYSFPFAGFVAVPWAPGPADFTQVEGINMFVLGAYGGVVSVAGLNVDIDEIRIPTVPEPATLALMGLGLAGIGYQRRRGKKAT